MAIALRGSPTTATGGEGSGSTLVINKPTGVVENDVLIAWVVWDTTPTITASGWTQITGSPLSNSDQRGAFWYKVAGGSEPSTYTFSGTSFDRAGGIIAFSGVDTSTPVEAQGSQTNSSTSSVTAPTITTSTDGAMLVFAGMMDSSAGSTVSATVPGGMTERVDVPVTSGWSWAYMATEIKATAGSTGTRVATASRSDDNGGFLIALKPGATFTIEQEGFAFGDDDGNEASHTLDTQDTNITEALGTKTLRLLANATDDPDNLAYKLKYQKDGSGGYEDVPLTSSSSGVAGPIEAGDVTQSDSNATSASLSVAHPAYVSGDLIIFNLSVWHYNTTVTIPSGPNGETGVAISNAAIASSGTNSPNAIAFYYIGTGTISASNLAVTANQTTRWDGGCVKVLAGEFDPSDPIGGTIGTDFSVADDTTPEIGAFSAAADDGGGKLIALVAVDQDPISGTPTGWTDILDDDAGRASIVISVRDSDVTDSESVTGDGGWTITNDAWTTLAYIVRPSADVTNEVYISASGNVTDGEATTARLTAPSGKAGDITAGRRFDTTNGVLTTDIASDFYSPFEYVLTTQVATNPDFFEFRLYKGDTAFDTYTVTPKWTIAAVGGATGKSNPLNGPLGGPLAGIL